jgi:phosphoribosyl 1,2-cyclic phosphodiesterase
MEICVIGSGSSGNCTLVRLGGALAMIDAGFGPRTTAKRLIGTGAAPSDIRAVLLTHLDRDHFQPHWMPTLCKRGITLYCHERHLYDLHRCEAFSGVDAHVLHRHGLLKTFANRPFDLEIDGSHAARVYPVPLAHDRCGSVGYRIEAASGHLGYATDLGNVPKALTEAMIDVDVLAIESNYDVPMQLGSERPYMLKRRIMGGAGHLSNEQALEALRHIFSRCRSHPTHIVLLHLSRQCNDPALVRRLYAQIPHLAQRLCISSQAEPTPWLTTGPRQPLAGEQLQMFA